MQSFLIASKSDNAAVSYVEKMCEDKHISVFDRQTIEPQKGSIGISEVRSLQKTLYLKPMQGKYKAIIIYHAESLTTEAQNALLKVLEEPPVHALIILTTHNADLLLPTIRSRCTLVTLDTPNQEATQKNVSEYTKIVESLTSYGVGERLKLAQDAGKTREEAVEWLENMIIAARRELLKSPHQYPAIITRLQKTHTILSTTNANPRLTLESMLLSL